MKFKVCLLDLITQRGRGNASHTQESEMPWRIAENVRRHKKKASPRNPSDCQFVGIRGVFFAFSLALSVSRSIRSASDLHDWIDGNIKIDLERIGIG